jgi:acetolactate synthase I/II/III large subunit
MKSAEFVARYLAARGVKYAFGHPGSDVMDLIAALEDAGVEFVLTHHENTGVYMAAAVARLTDTPGVVLVTKGPGVTNASTGMGSAHLDRAPVLLLSSHFGAPADAVNVRQHIPSVDYYKPITKFSSAWSADDIHSVLPAAVETAMTDYPGPAFLGSVAAEQLKDVGAADDELERLISTAPSTAPSAAIDAAAVAAAAQRLSTASKLLVVVGPGVEHHAARAEMLSFVDALGVPACATPEAVGWLPADHPLYAGMLGWHDRPLIELSEEADVMVTIGLDGADLMMPYKGSAEIVNLAPLAGDPRAFSGVVASVPGDLRHLLPAVADATSTTSDWGKAKAAETRDAIDALMAVSADHDPTSGIAPQDIFFVGRDVLPSNTVFTCDVGAHKIVAGTVWKSNEPDTFLMSNGFGSMGYGLPSAMGAKLARPDSPVISVVGDGGLLMYAGDLATWARLQLPLTLVVMVDNNLTQVQRRQEKSGYSVKSTTFQEIDYCAVAASFGIDGVRVSTPEEYRAALERSVAANTPFLIEAMLDDQEYRRIPGWR